jgi:hypothetical protein
MPGPRKHTKYTSCPIPLVIARVQILMTPQVMRNGGYAMREPYEDASPHKTKRVKRKDIMVERAERSSVNRSKAQTGECCWEIPLGIDVIELILGFPRVVNLAVSLLKRRDPKTRRAISCWKCKKAIVDYPPDPTYTELNIQPCTYGDYILVEKRCLHCFTKNVTYWDRSHETTAFP